MEQDGGGVRWCEEEKDEGEVRVQGEERGEEGRGAEEGVRRRRGRGAEMAREEETRRLFKRGEEDAGKERACWRGISDEAKRIKRGANRN